MTAESNKPLHAQASSESEAAGRADPQVPGREASAESEVIRAEGAISPGDLFGANKLANKEKPFDVIWPVGMSSMLFLGICVGSAVARDFEALPGAAIFLAIGLGVGVRALYRLRRVSRSWREGRGLFQAQTVEISEEGIRQQMEDRSTAYRWNAFSKYAASKRVLILHFDPPDGWFVHTMRGYLIISRQLFPSDGEWERVVQLIQRKLPRRYRDRTTR